MDRDVVGWSDALETERERIERVAIHAARRTGVRWAVAVGGIHLMRREEHPYEQWAAAGEPNPGDMF